MAAYKKYDNVKNYNQNANILWKNITNEHFHKTILKFIKFSSSQNYHTNKINLKYSTIFFIQTIQPINSLHT